MRLGTLGNRSSRSLTHTVVLASLACLLLAPAQARTVQQKKQAARSQYQIAERMREALDGKPEAQRTRRDYDRVLEAYRKVYHTAPNVHEADAAILAVADLLDEQGRVLNDPKSYKDAIGQLEFLRREYPGSKLRAEALFTIAQIYNDDLDDAAQAKTTFQEFLKHYPHSSMAADAQQALDNMETESAQNSARVKAIKNAVNAQARDNKDTSKGKDEKEEEATPKQDAKDAKNDARRPALLTNVRHWSTPDYTRVAIDLEQEVKYEAGRVPNPDRIFFDLHGVKLAPGLGGKTFAVENGFLHKIRVAQYKANLARVVLDVDDVAEYSAFLLPNPYRLIIDIHGKLPATQVAKQKPPAPVETKKQPEIAAASDSIKKDPVIAETKTPAEKPVETAKLTEPKPDETKIEDSDKTTSKPTTAPTVHVVAPEQSARTKTKKKQPQSVTHVAEPTASGERSLIRALGLKIGKIVIDAGHGGHDTGTIGPNGLMEKELVLDVALKLGKMLEDRLGAEVVYTRDDDTFIPLETRTAIANKEQADLFISVHANSSHDASARGIETYYLNFTSSADALEVAARENSVSEKSIHELQDLVKKIALKEKIEESREFAADVQKSLYTGLVSKNPGLRDRGVKKAPFIVLIGANMPSILAEISFVSNPGDEKKLKTNDYRQRIADSLFKGVSKYVNGLSGVKVAAKLSAEKQGN